MPNAVLADGVQPAQAPDPDADPFKPTGKAWSILFRVFASALLSYTAYMGQSIPDDLGAIRESIQVVGRRVDGLESSLRTDRMVKLALDSAEQVWKQRYRVK